MCLPVASLLLPMRAARQPDVVLLVGPWLDVEHPLVRLGALPCSFEAAFEEVGKGGHFPSLSPMSLIC